MGGSSRRRVSCHQSYQANAAWTAESVVAETRTILTNAYQSNRDGDPLFFDYRPFCTYNAPTQKGRFAIEVGFGTGLLLDTSQAPRSTARVDERSVLILRYGFCNRTLAIYACAQEILAPAYDRSVCDHGHTPGDHSKQRARAFHLHTVLSQHASARHFRVLSRQRRGVDRGRPDLVS